MLFNIILMLISHFLSFQSDAVNISDQSRSYEDADAYEVYSAILPSDWTWRVANAKTIVIRIQTTGYHMCLRPEPESERIIGDAISEYIKLNEKPWMFQKHFGIEKQYELISSDELKSIFEQGGWEKFYERYPDSRGWIDLSAVGFNSDKTVAVVYMGHHCGSLCGGGGFHVLQKKNDKWVPLVWKGSTCAWAS